MAKINGEQKKAIFIGKDIVSIGNIIKKDNVIHFKKIPSKPFIDKYVQIMGNIDKFKFETKKLYDPLVGVTDNEIEIFWFDLKQQEYGYNVPIEFKLEIKSLRVENQKLKLENETLRNKLFENGNEDLGRKKLKDDVKWTNEIKYGSDSSGGGMGGSPFGGSPFNR